nr:hypothetical protein [Tanacetum cinerariifolium]
MREVDGHKALILIPATLYPNGVPVKVRLVVSGDGKGNGGDGISSGGENKAACLAMHAFIDADMDGSSLTVFPGRTGSVRIKKKTRSPRVLISIAKLGVE